MFTQGGPVQDGFNARQKIVVVLMNALLLAELTFSIYLGHRAGEDMAITFLWTFIPMVIATLILARIFIRKLGPR